MLKKISNRLNLFMLLTIRKQNSLVIDGAFYLRCHRNASNQTIKIKETIRHLPVLKDKAVTEPRVEWVNDTNSSS